MVFQLERRVKTKLNANKNLIILLGSQGAQDAQFSLPGIWYCHITPQCTELAEFFTFLWARSAAGANQHEGFDLGGTRPIFSREGVGADMFPSV